MDIVHLREWAGREEHAKDEITRAPVRALSATLDRDDPDPQPGDPLPPLYHWLFFLPHHRQSELDADGHVRRGGFLPPVPLPYRMWAGSRLEFRRPLRIGDRVSRVSRITDVIHKEGRTGPLVFVKVRHEIGNAQGLAVVDEHDIVYRERTGAAATKPAPSGQMWERAIEPDAVLLFRYSALTFNGHRIHYDRRYTTQVEGYPGLVVHGPLIATLLMDLVRRSLPGADIAGFSFRAVSPLFDTAPFAVCGKPQGDSVLLWAKNAQGGVAMEAECRLRG